MQMQSCSLRTQASAVDLANEVVWVVGGDVGLQRLGVRLGIGGDVSR